VVKQTPSAVEAAAGRFVCNNWRLSGTSVVPRGGNSPAPARQGWTGLLFFGALVRSAHIISTPSTLVVVIHFHDGDLSCRYMWAAACAVPGGCDVKVHNAVGDSHRAAVSGFPIGSMVKRLCACDERVGVDGRSTNRFAVAADPADSIRNRCLEGVAS